MYSVTSSAVYNALKTPNVNAINFEHSSNDWREQLGFSCYYYEQAGASSQYNLPSDYCCVFVHNVDMRGVAIAVKWEAPTPKMWINASHKDVIGDWGTWREVSLL